MKQRSDWGQSSVLHQCGQPIQLKTMTTLQKPSMFRRTQSLITIMPFATFVNIGLSELQVTNSPNKIVEIDESKFFKAKYNRGRMLNRAYDWVFGMIERGTNRMAFFTVPKRDAATLLPLIQQYIAPGTIVASDGWRAYGTIAQLQQQYDHLVINHNTHFVDPSDARVHTRSIEDTWGVLKRSLKHMCGTSADNLPSYMFQYMFRRYHGKQKILNHLLYELGLVFLVG